MKEDKWRVDDEHKKTIIYDGYVDNEKKFTLSTERQAIELAEMLNNLQRLIREYNDTMREAVGVIAKTLGLYVDG